MYSGVPIFVTSFYAVFIKLVLYSLFLKFAYQFSSLIEFEYTAILSLIIGCFGAIRQFEVKRFLAYSSITHIGFLLAGGDINALLIYILTYVLASLAFFIVMINISTNGSEITYLTDLRFVNSSCSQLDRLLLLFALSSMAGLPPFAGFYGKIIV